MSDAQNSPSPSHPEDWIGGRFEVLEQIGTGGVGDVFRAWDHHLKRSVAIKRMRNERNNSNRKILEQTWREAMTTACLQHPHIVTVFDYGMDEQGGAYVVMELILGETLEVILNRGPLDLSDFHRFAQQALEGLIAAHSIGLMHRDIKPGNFMLTNSPNGHFHVKILDFGLAKYLDRPEPQSMDHLNSLMGSIHYMAPEQFQRLPIDPRTDLYSIGCIFYETVTGHTAFDAENVSDLIDAHIKTAPHPIHQLRPDISPKLEHWIMRFIEKDPDRRHGSAAHALQEMPVLADCRRKRRPLTAMLLEKLTIPRQPE